VSGGELRRRGTSNSKRELGYAFVPVPQWIEEQWETGEMTDEVERLHRVLYRRADLDALAGRGESPRLKLTTLARALRCDPEQEAALEALSRMLRRERERGRLDYRTEGKTRRGRDQIVYVFTLFCDGARPVRPRSANKAARGSANQSGANPLEERTSTRDEEQPVRQSGSDGSGGESANRARESANRRIAKPRGKRDSAESTATPVRDVQNYPETPGYEGATEEVLGRTPARTDERASANEDKELARRARERYRRDHGKPLDAADAIRRAQAAQPQFDGMPSRSKPESAP
jgi:hypothetical protein